MRCVLSSVGAVCPQLPGRAPHGAGNPVQELTSSRVVCEVVSDKVVSKVNALANVGGSSEFRVLMSQKTGQTDQT
jgi:hypothetical protein